MAIDIATADDIAIIESEVARLWSREFPPPDQIDPVTAAFLPGVDRSLLRANLKLSVEERLLKAESAAELSAELQRAGERHRALHSG